LSDISEKAKVRLLGGALSDKPAPKLAWQPQPAAVVVTPAPNACAPVAAPPVFLADSVDGADVLDVNAIVQPLARLCASPQTQTPFIAAIAGPGGAGKSFALARLARSVEANSGSPGALSRVVVARVDASSGPDAAIALASAAYSALDRDPGGVEYSPLLDECSHAGGDPLRAAKSASDRHEEVVRKLEAARAERDEVEARGARLTDSLLFETPGSRVDVHARARRGAIEARLRRFGLAGSDATLSYRDLVREAAGMGPAGRAGIALRAIWAYPGQRRLLFWAIVAFAVGFGLKLIPGATIPDALSSATTMTGGVADSATNWTRGHADWFETASKVLYVIGALALALNLWRAVSFATLLSGGARLLNADVGDRRRDLHTRIARLNQRVGALSGDADSAAKHAEAALRRAGGKAQTRAPGPEFLDAAHNAASAARAFLAALGERIGASAGAPARLVFAIDNLDALPPSAAASWIGAAQGAIGAGSVAVLALDPARLVEPLGGKAEAIRRFDKWLQAVVNLPGRAGVDGERLVARLLSSEGPSSLGAVDAKVASAVAEPLTPAETALLTALAPLAARSPRDAKKFLNAYRLARTSGVPRPAVALMLAVAVADDDARSGMTRVLAVSTGEVGDAEGPDALARAIRSARAASEGVLSIADIRAAETVARRYALSL
jgi:hypothetical protein